MRVFNAPEDVNAVLIEGELTILEDSSGIAYFTADYVEILDSTSFWTLELELSNGMNWEEWSTQSFPSSYRDETEQVTDEYQDWQYYILTCGKLIGTGNRDGSYYDLVHSPSNLYFGFQIGHSANAWNSNFGASTWATGSGIYTDIEDGVNTESETQFTLIFDIDEASEIDAIENVTYDCTGDFSDSIIKTDELPFLLYPNPANYQLNLTLTGNYSKLEILSVYGTAVQVFDTPEASGTYQFDISSLATGSYLVKYGNHVRHLLKE